MLVLQPSSPIYWLSNHDLRVFWHHQGYLPQKGNLSTDRRRSLSRVLLQASSDSGLWSSSCIIDEQVLQKWTPRVWWCGTVISHSIFPASDTEVTLLLLHTSYIQLDFLNDTWISKHLWIHSMWMSLFLTCPAGGSTLYPKCFFTNSWFGKHNNLIAST